MKTKLPERNSLCKGRENPSLGPLRAVLSSATRQCSRWHLLGGARWHQISAGGRLIRLRVFRAQVSWALDFEAEVSHASESDHPCC